MTVKLFQFHASRLGIDNFLDNSSKVSRSWDCSRDAPRLYEESREAVKRNGNGSVQPFVYSNFVLGFSIALGVCWRMLQRAQAGRVSAE